MADYFTQLSPHRGNEITAPRRLCYCVSNSPLGAFLTFINFPSLFCSRTAGGTVRVKPSKTEKNAREVGNRSDWSPKFLHHYSGWAHWRSTQQGSFPTQDPLPHWASIINQPLLHFSHLSKKARVLLSTGPPPIIVGHWGSVPLHFFGFFFLPHLFMIEMEMQPSSSKWDFHFKKTNKH